MILTDDKGKQFDQTLTQDKKEPVCFKFDKLNNNVKYNVTLKDENIELLVEKSSFKTFSGNIDDKNVKMAFLSCNKVRIALEIKPELDLWGDLYNKIENNEINYILHIGDQVYSDDEFYLKNYNNPYGRSVKLLESVDKDKWPDYNQTIYED